MNQNRQTITIQNRTTDCKKLFEFLLDYVDSNDISDDIFNDLKLIIEETFVNIASYAHEENETQTVTVELSSNTETISITFSDTGIAFNPITDCNKDIEKIDPCEGGMGIHIIKSLSDHLEYKRIKQRNVFTVTKHYTKQQ
ncbi:MAG: ATP-binding protein [Gammaproteobacteria bacterium]